MRNYTYKIRTVSNGRDKKGEKFMTRYLTVPREIAEITPKNQQFLCTVDDDGIHYRPVEVEELKPERPSWAYNGAAEEEPEEKPAPRRRKRPQRA